MEDTGRAGERGGWMKREKRHGDEKREGERDREKVREMERKRQREKKRGGGGGEGRKEREKLIHVCKDYRVMEHRYLYASLGSRLDSRYLLMLYFLKRRKTVTYFTNECTMQRTAIKPEVFKSQRRSVLF